MQTEKTEPRCPRCRYPLRGLSQPRCPECGFAFDWESYHAGRLRENLPSFLDRADPWQLHQVLICSLVELMRGLVRPWWILWKLDANGPRWSGPVMLLCAVLWLWLISSLILAAATLMHVNVSPAAAATNALWSLGPRVVAASLLVALAPMPALLACLAKKGAAPGMRAAVRVGGYLLAVLAGYGCLAASLTALADAELARGAFSRVPLLGPVAGIFLLFSRRVGVFWRWELLVVFLVVLLVSRGLLRYLVPASLEPGWWVYGL